MVSAMRELLRDVGELLAGLPAPLVGVGVLLGIAAGLGAVAFF